MSLVKEVAFIGCGQAGGNIVSLFADEYNSLFQIANAEGVSIDVNKAIQ